ncbi:MAG: hypothetical protein R2771_13575 [Saprospiraceae bacterium]
MTITADIIVSANYSVTVSDKLGCFTKSASVTLTQTQAGCDFDEDGYCDEDDCAPFSASIGGPGSSCDDGDPNTVDDILDSNCECYGIPNPCEHDDDNDGICADIDCDDQDPSVKYYPGFPCDDGDPATVNDVYNSSCNCEGEYDQSLCSGKVTIDIYDGLNDNGNPGQWGGEIVKKGFFGGGRDKYNDGALTVANLNDTDGDGIIDKDDVEVLVSTTGINETDLMKLEIKPSGYSSGCKVKLEYIGDIAFYYQYTKGTQVTNLELDATQNTTLWVEARSVSSQLRDIEIIAKVNGKEEDKIAATAIWVEKKDVYYDDISKIELPIPGNIGINNSVLEDIINTSTDGYRAVDDSRYGFGSCKKNSLSILGTSYYTNEDSKFGGRILFEFEIFPHDIVPLLSSYNITFDIARRKKVRDELYQPGIVDPDIIPPIDYNFPYQNEQANDDPQNLPTTGDYLDEDNSPTGFEIFSFDAPTTGMRSEQVGSTTNILSTYAVVFRDIDFEEFTRLAFKNGNLLKGDHISGSRCSKKINWSINYATYSYDSHDPYNPYDRLYQYHAKANAGDIIITKPRYRYLGTGGNGKITISHTGNIFKNYILKLHTDNKFYLLDWDTVSGQWTNIAGSTSNNSPWSIQANGLDINIISASGTNARPFKQGDEYLFRVIKVPSNNTNKLESN